jgi:hypothetical protein
MRASVLALWLVTPASLLWATWLMLQPYLQSAGTVLIYPSGFGFDLLGAIAWTAYLTQSPQVHRLYPGHRRYNELVTDVDVF